MKPLLGKTPLGKTLLGTGAALILTGMTGWAGMANAEEVSITRDPAEVPTPIARTEPATIQVTLETIERVAKLNDGSDYRFWTFNNQVPGPMIRARVGDTVELRVAGQAIARGEVVVVEDHLAVSITEVFTRSTAGPERTPWVI